MTANWMSLGCGKARHQQAFLDPNQHFSQFSDILWTKQNLLIKKKKKQIKVQWKKIISSPISFWRCVSCFVLSLFVHSTASLRSFTPQNTQRLLFWNPLRSVSVTEACKQTRLDLKFHFPHATFWLYHFRRRPSARSKLEVSESLQKLQSFHSPQLFLHKSSTNKDTADFLFFTSLFHVHYCFSESPPTVSFAEMTNRQWFLNHLCCNVPKILISHSRNRKLLYLFFPHTVWEHHTSNSASAIALALLLKHCNMSFM